MDRSNVFRVKFGTFYDVGYGQHQRVQTFERLGALSLILFLIIRGVNVYGDLIPWTSYDTISQSAMSFFLTLPNTHHPYRIYQ